MKHFVDLISAVALLVWGTYLVRTGILRVFGDNLRDMLSRNLGSRPKAALAGLGVTVLVQSSTATALITTSFVAQGLVQLPTALAAMLGADVGTALMAVVLSFDLSWLSPLLIFIGVTLFLARQDASAGRLGRVLIGLGLMLLALRLISEATSVMVRSEAVRTLLTSLGSDLLLEITIGALLTLLAHSSLAVVLLAATLTSTGALSMDIAIGLVLGANLGGGLLAVIVTARSDIKARRVPLGNIFFKLGGVLLAAPIAAHWPALATPYLGSTAAAVVLFHLALNLCIAVVFLAFTDVIAAWARKMLPLKEPAPALGRLNHLDRTALTTPSLAISCAAREAMQQADIVETMLRGILKVIKEDDLKLAQDLRTLEDDVDALYSNIKYYLTNVPRQALGEEESRRWSDILAFTINMEQIADIAERVLLDVEVKKICKGRQFSQAGMSEICELHAHLLANLQLAMNVFLNGSVNAAKKLLEAKARFRDLEHRYAATHLERLADNSAQSIETSSLHLDLISELKRINSLICAVAYPILDSVGALAPNRLVDEVNALKGQRICA